MKTLTLAKDGDAKEPSENGRRHDAHEVQGGLEETPVPEQTKDEGQRERGQTDYK